MVQVGLKLFHELGERTRKTEAEVQAYQDALAQVAAREGVAVPELSGDRGASDLERLREWLGQVVSGPLAAEEEKSRGGQTRSGGSGRRARGESRVLSGRGTRDPVAVKGTWSDCTSPALLSTHGGRRQVMSVEIGMWTPSEGCISNPRR